MKNRKTFEKEALDRFHREAVLLSPLIIRGVKRLGQPGAVDAYFKLMLPNAPGSYRFAVEIKSQNTPLAVRGAIAQLKAAMAPGDSPMIIVPYLSPERLSDLERVQVSGVDLCGNGIVIVPGRLYILRTGQPNLYPASRPLGNPYAGQSALAARMLLAHPRWESLKDLVAAIGKSGARLSMSQASKAVWGMQEDLIVFKQKRMILLKEPVRLLDKLSQSYKKLLIATRQALRLPPGANWAECLSSDSSLRWAVTGESSVTRYAVFGQGGPLRIAVSSMSQALKLVGGVPERIANFADIELLETDEPGFFFMNEIDEKGTRWASRLQTWLELQAGDARQQDAAQDLREQILKDSGYAGITKG
ncbi:MAG: hypothetical protein NTX50_05210 [Candidatus Sumerlaeota bacterium]|nr:hypothetical protein [Candidatus Sumerlaeota bacterium]